MAKSASDAIKLDKMLPVDSVWVDDDWLQEHTKHTIGFQSK
jgi:hypothetical protein